jgi:tetratricopeptide (TPR) repeat protein
VIEPVPTFMGAMTRWVLCGVIAAVFSGCASDPAMLAWEARLRAADRQYFGEQYQKAARQYRKLEASSLTRVDRDLMRLRGARALNKAGQFTEGTAMLRRVGSTAFRRSDRARAFYDLASLVENQGDTDSAVTVYRRLTETYPELMPGASALLHLERIARTHPDRMKAHLAWTHGVFPQLAQTKLGDNMLYFAARHAYDVFRKEGHPASGKLAERLYKQLAKMYDGGSRWHDALWGLSHLYYRRGDHRREIAIIRRMQRKRRGDSGLGSSSHPLYWVGDLRVAWLHLMKFKDIGAAIQDYEAFIDRYRRSRWRDDVLFWQGCLYLKVGDKSRAEAAFSRIPKVYKYSKYIARVPQARQSPHGPVCQPKSFAEGTW